MQTQNSRNSLNSTHPLSVVLPTALGLGLGGIGSLVSPPSLGDALSQRSPTSRVIRGSSIGAGAGLGAGAGFLLGRHLLKDHVGPNTAELLSLVPGIGGAILGGRAVRSLTKTPGDKYEDKLIEAQKSDPRSQQL